MSTAFYKTSDATVLAAIKTYGEQGAAVSAAGNEFARHYGGKLLTESNAHGRRVAGLCFLPAKDDPLWTKPDGQSAGLQKPRASLRKSTKEQRAALVELQADWKARFPTLQADMAPVLTAIGTDWGSLFFCGFAMFEHNGHVYVSTSAPLAPCMVEIVASEYNAVRADYEKVKGAT